MSSAGLQLTSILLDPHNSESDPVHVLPHACTGVLRGFFFIQKPWSQTLDQDGDTCVRGGRQQL